MATADGGDVWSSSQLAAQLVALSGGAPDPVQHVIFRATQHADGTLVEGYDIPGERRMLTGSALDFWLSLRRLAGAERLAVSVLVIRETLDADGLIAQGTIERRRGMADGPYYGDPARVDFIGAAGAVRLYRSHLDGRLSEIAPSADMTPPRVRSPEQFAGEQKVLQARFGDGVHVLDAREPTLFEDMIGLSSIVHVCTADGREVGCGIGWHGSMAFVLEADFPRFGSPLALLPDDAAAIEAALQANDLVRGETRLDELGVAVVARQRGGETLSLLRPRSGRVVVEPYLPNRDIGGPDQQRWMRYAETYEGLAVLDAWHDAASEDLLVLTGDLSGQVWRHHIDIDGVETWRKTDDEAAVGPLHRERLAPGTLAATDAEAVPDSAPVMPEVRSAPLLPAAEDSLLARAETYVHAMAALRAARDAADANAVAPQLRLLHAALLALQAYVAASTVQEVLARLADGSLAPDGLAPELAQLEAWLRRELAQNRSVIVAPSHSRFMQCDESPLGADVTRCFPSIGYDVEEAALCLALRRPAASVFHCMRILQRGIAAFAHSIGVDAAGESDWPTLLGLLHGAAAQGCGAPRDALDMVRRRWRGTTLLPADKYTETEAEQIFQATGEFMRALAAHCDEHGRPHAPIAEGRRDASGHG